MGGLIRIIKNGAILPAPSWIWQPGFCCGDGLLGLAFQSNYAGNGYFFVNYSLGMGRRSSPATRFPNNNADLATSA
jgi:hypothetical protein